MSGRLVSPTARVNRVNRLRYGAAGSGRRGRSVDVVTPDGRPRLGDGGGRALEVVVGGGDVEAVDDREGGDPARRRPERSAVSRAAVSRTMSQAWASRESGKFVTATVVAPLARAASTASIVSRVVPECEMPMATSPSRSSAALVRQMCGSFHAKATTPIRCSFCWASMPTVALAPMP